MAAGTSPNVTYERERPGSFEIDTKAKAFKSHRAVVQESGAVALEPVERGQVGFFTSYLRDGRTVSYYGDNHPIYAGSVVRAMASAKDGAPHVEALFARDIAALRSGGASAARDAAWRAFATKLDGDWRAEVVRVDRLTPTIVEVVVNAPAAARHFEPGQFFRLQNFEALSPTADGHRLVMEGLALTGAWVDKEAGLLSLIVLEMGGSSRLVTSLQPGEPVVVMGPTGTPTETPAGESVAAGGRRSGQRRAVLDRAGAARGRQPRAVLRRLSPPRRHLQGRRHRGGGRSDHLERRRGRGRSRRAGRRTGPSSATSCRPWAPTRAASWARCWCRCPAAIA